MTEGEDYQSLPSVLVWNLVFMSGERTHWWDWFTHKDWRHVCAYGYCTSHDCWVVYDVADARSVISILDDTWFDRWCAVRRDRITAMVRFKVTDDPPDIRARAGLWCVTAMKHLIGLRSGALRPYALLRDCLLHGGKLVVRNHDGNESAKTGGGVGRTKGST